MAMIINDHLQIEVADSDVAMNRRLSNTNSRSSSETRNYYINDDYNKYNEILDWFNGFSEDNTYYINSNKTKGYIALLKKVVLPYKDSFVDGLDNILEDISNFNTNFIDDFVEIPKLTRTGDNLRYLKFDNSNYLVKLFRRLIIGRITSIIISKVEKNFYLHLEFNKDYLGLIYDFSQDSNNYIAEKSNSYSAEKSNTIQGGFNKIYYGTPGCGKSHYVKEKYEKADNIVIRTTFYPDYSNSDFVGQILPRLDMEDNSVYYDFNPGVFSSALLNSLKFFDKKIILIIEEINRGNAAAIFGETFQLLDRDELGKSKYNIKIPQLEQWLLKNGQQVNSIYLPSNLHIIATMNTSDQNVFTLDTAFKRRWIMEHVSNKFEDKLGLEWFDWYVPGSKYTWREFVNQINTKIIEQQHDGFTLEDKRIGIFFVGPNELVSTQNYVAEKIESAAKAFAFKVLMYIWEDVAKISRDDWFSDIKSLDQLIDSFLIKSLYESKEDSLLVFKGLFEDLEWN